MTIKYFRDTEPLETTRLAFPAKTQRVSARSAKALSDIVCMRAHPGSQRGGNSSHVTYRLYRAAIYV